MQQVSCLHALLVGAGGDDVQELLKADTAFDGLGLQQPTQQPTGSNETPSP